MKILEKTTMKDGTPIQLEYWNNHYTIGVYPIAERNSKYWIHAGQRFRLTISENKYRSYTAENVKADYLALKEDKKTLADLRKYFWNGEDDAHILGLDSGKEQ